MLASVTRISLGFAFCSMFWACDNCIAYQDMAGARIRGNIDSVAVIVNDSIVGCGHRYRSGIGSKTHGIKFPINMQIKLFADDSLWKEFSIEMQKNTILAVYRGEGCSESHSPVEFHNRMASAKKSNMYIDSYSADDYCWLFEKMDGSYDNYRCVEMSTGGEVDFCQGWF